MATNWTENQELAINTIGQNMQIVACAGSGKTSTMVAHILRLLEEDDVEPENIVAITYTEKAAASLKQKVFDEYKNLHNSIEGLANMYIGTIHGFCLYMLQEYSDEYKSYETLNDVQTKLFIKRTRKFNGLFDVVYHGANGNTYHIANEMSKADKLAQAINAYKSFLDIAREHGSGNISTELQNVISKYENELSKKRFFDFTSIIMVTLDKLLAGTFDQHIVGKIKYLIVDEYQDVNASQERIIRYFAEKGTYVCVVGDDDQTIYQWRGSNLNYIKDFSSNYSNVKKIDLDVNFRSSKGITEISKQVISQNNNRLAKDMKSNESQQYESGDIITYEFDDRTSEVDFIVKKIKQLSGCKFVRKGKEFKLALDDMVILISSVKKIPELIESLERNGIDFIVEGTKSLFDTEEISIICDSFSLIFDNININRIVDKEQIASCIKAEGIPSELISRWKVYSPISDEAISQALLNFACGFCDSDDYEYTIQGNIRNLFSELQLFSVEDEKILYNWGKFTEMVNDFEKINLDIMPVYRLISFKTFLQQDAPEIYPEGWLSPSFKAVKCLRIMTFHQSKGLEYPVVFMPFLTKHSIFPQRNPGGLNAWGIINDITIKRQYEDNNESIRRVFYVGMTRSEKFLFLTRSNHVSDTGKTTYRDPAFPFVEAKNSPFKETRLFLDKEYENCDKEKFSTDEVITLNFSLLKDLFDCPYKFKMTNVYGFCSPLNIRMGYGRSIHNMLDYIHKNYNQINLSDPQVISGIVDKYLHLPYGSPKLYEAMTEKATKNLTSYIRNNASRFQYMKLPNNKEVLFMEKHITDEKTGISYTLHGDYYIPDLTLPPQETYPPLGKYGMLRETYLKEHRQGTYALLQMDGALRRHLRDVDERANEILDQTVKSLAEKEKCDETLKRIDPMKWVGLMNNYRNAAEEIIFRELIYV